MLNIVTTYVVIMKMTLTEFDKAILLGMLVVTKGSIKKRVKEENILLKFPTRQRKNARNSLIRLSKLNLIKKNGKNFKLTEKGLREAKKLMIEGAPIWG